MEKVINCPCGLVLRGKNHKEVTEGAGAREERARDGPVARTGARDREARVKGGVDVGPARDHAGVMISAKVNVMTFQPG